MTLRPNQIGRANRLPARQSDGSVDLSATLAADRAFPAAVVELGREAALHTLRIHHIAVVVVLGVLTLLATSCSKMTPEEAAEVRISFGLPADIPLKDLGAVKLRVGTPQRVRAGKNENCTITATTQPNGNIRFNLLYESDGEIINGVKVQPYSEKTQTEISQRLLAIAMKSKSWLCFPRMHANFVVAMRPVVMP